MIVQRVYVCTIVISPYLFLIFIISIMLGGNVFNGIWIGQEKSLTEIFLSSISCMGLRSRDYIQIQDFEADFP